MNAYNGRFCRTLRDAFVDDHEEPLPGALPGFNERLLFATIQRRGRAASYLSARHSPYKALSNSGIKHNLLVSSRRFLNHFVRTVMNSINSLYSMNVAGLTPVAAARPVAGGHG